MGKRSIKENKNIYQISREALNLTREEASERMCFVSADRIEKIENERSAPRPEEILAMSEAYQLPELCNHFCTHACPIGQKSIPELEPKDLSRIVLEMVASLNIIDQKKNRLIEIGADGALTPDEYEDFRHIREHLSQIAISISTLQLWIDKRVAEGKIEPDI